MNIMCWLPLLNQRKKKNKYFIYNVFDNKRNMALLFRYTRSSWLWQNENDKLRNLHVYNIRIIFLGIYRDMYITQFRIYLFLFFFLDLFFGSVLIFPLNFLHKRIIEMTRPTLIHGTDSFHSAWEFKLIYLSIRARIVTKVRRVSRVHALPFNLHTSHTYRQRGSCVHIRMYCTAQRWKTRACAQTEWQVQGIVPNYFHIPLVKKCD